MTYSQGVAHSIYLYRDSFHLREVPIRNEPTTLDTHMHMYTCTTALKCVQ